MKNLIELFLLVINPRLVSVRLAFFLFVFIREIFVSTVTSLNVSESYAFKTGHIFR